MRLVDWLEYSVTHKWSGARKLGEQRAECSERTFAKRDTRRDDQGILQWFHGVLVERLYHLKHTHPSKSTVMNYLKCLKAAFNMAIEEEIMDDNPVLRLRMDVLKVAAPSGEYLTVDEVKRLIDTPLQA